jgi:O-antigen ligase
MILKGKIPASFFDFLNSFLLLIIFLLPFYFLRISLSLGGTLSILDFLLFFFILFSIFPLIDNFFSNRRALKSEQGYFFSKQFFFFGVFLILEGVVASYLLNVTSDNWQNGLGILKSFYFLPIIFSGVVLSLVFKKKISLKKMFLVYYCLTALLSFLGIIFVFYGKLAYDGRLSLWNDSPNQLAFFLAPGLIIGGWLWKKIKREDGYNHRNFWIASGSLVLIGWALLRTESLGALWGLLVAFLFLFWPNKINFLKKRFFYPFFLGIFFSFFLALFFLAQILQSVHYSPFLNRSSLDSRLVIYQVATKIVTDNPISGIGADNFLEKYLFYQKYFQPYPQWAVPHPHNLLLNFWLEGGLGTVLGFSLLLLLLVPYFFGNKNKEENLVAAIFLFFLASGMFDTSFWKNDLAVVFWLFFLLNFFNRSKDKSSF